MAYHYDAELVSMLELLPDTSFTISNPQQARASFLEMTASLNADLDESGVVIANQTIAGPEGAPAVPVRIYTPEGLNAAVPALLHIHGGGFVIGSLDSEHGSCVALCRRLGVVIISVDYRLAPETPYPGPLEDCYAALVWTSSNSARLLIDPARVAVFGQSAGGGLAAAVALLARDRKGPQICFQYLGIPELDDRLETASMKRFVDTPMWNRPNAELSWDFYLGDQYQRGAPDVPYLAAPARAEDLAGLPPAYVNTMEFDPLRDEGVEYAVKLMRAGVATELHSFPGTFHGSSIFSSAQISRRESAEMFAVLRRALQIEA
jgi:acetyl esterase|tara:strand:+ start:7203 stop:8162 length:960 start_codon:yes stop_codon:yes gene_type:complete